MKKPKIRGNQRYTESGYFSWIRAQLRRAKYPVKYDALAASKRKLLVKKGNQRFEYQCNICKEWFKGTEVQVDHIKPVGTLKTFDDLPDFCANLFCELDNFQTLCKPCHQIKTNAEREAKKKL